MDDSEQRLQELFQKLIHEYVERFHEPCFHFGESYPQSLTECIKDIQHWLDIDKPKPWGEVPDDALI